MNEDKATGCAWPPTLVEEKIAEAIINLAAVILFESLGLMSGSANDNIGAEVDEMAEKLDLIAGGRVGIVAGGVFGGEDVTVTFVVLNVDDDEVSALFGGSDIGGGFFFGVEIGAWRIVERVAAGG